MRKCWSAQSSARKSHVLVQWLPIPEGRARDEHGFDKSQFNIDWQAQQLTCPQGKTSRYWIPPYDRHGKDVIQIKFNPTDCKVCPSRELCTQAKAGARMLAIHPDQAQHQALQQEGTIHIARLLELEQDYLVQGITSTAFIPRQYRW